MNPMTRATVCSHCGLPVPVAYQNPEVELQFCCSGCETVYHMLHQCDLQPLYEQVQSERNVPDPRSHVPPAYAEFDDEVFHQLYVRQEAGGIREIELYVEGVHCAACVWLLEKLPTICTGVVEARLDFRRSLLRVRWDVEQIRLSQVAGILDRLGYPPHAYRDRDREAKQRTEDRRNLIRIAVAGASAGNTMLIAFALYGGVFSEMSPEHRDFFRWASLIVALPAVLWAGNVFFRGAWSALRTRTLHMDLPIAIGIIAGFVWGIRNTIVGAGEIYFDSVTALIFLLLVGRWLQHRQQRVASQAAEILYSLSPSKARKIQGEQSKEVPIEALMPGDQIEVKAGESIPVDGMILLGTTQLDLSVLTGESMPVDANVGDTVLAGSVNLSTRLLIQVVKTGSETRLGQLLRQVEEANQRRAPIVKQADRLAGWFVAVVLCMAVLTFVLWWLRDPTHAIEYAVALLIVTCPCALGLATPLALSAGLGKAAQQGILIKGGDVIEALSRPGQLWLDKTGTLTAGQMKLMAWSGDSSWQPLVRAMEEHSSHPIARAFVEAFAQTAPVPDVQVEHRMGQGLIGTWQGKTILIGSPALVREQCGILPEETETTLEAWTQRALTPVVLAVDGVVKAVAGLGDPIRPDSYETLQFFRNMGWQIGILSGDHPVVVQAVAQQLGLNPSWCHGGLSPEDKVAFVTSQPHSTVVMVGDGVNDAAALSAATVGIGVHGGAEACLAIADVYLTQPGLRPLRTLLQGGRNTMRVIQRNLGFSLAYNVLGATLAIAGLISPLWAAVLMPLSSITVITSSYRAQTFGGVSCPSSTSYSPSPLSSPQSL